jgi:ribosomal protein L37AE/L43A
MKKEKVNLISVAFNKAPDHCEECNKKVKEADDLRPYGKNGTWICFKCGMKNKEETVNQFNKMHTGLHPESAITAIEIVKKLKKKP